MNKERTKTRQNVRIKARETSKKPKELEVQTTRRVSLRLAESKQSIITSEHSEKIETRQNRRVSSRARPVSMKPTLKKPAAGLQAATPMQAHGQFDSVSRSKSIRFESESSESKISFVKLRRSKKAKFETLELKVQ